MKRVIGGREERESALLSRAFKVLYRPEEAMNESFVTKESLENSLGWKFMLKNWGIFPESSKWVLSISLYPWQWEKLNVRFSTEIMKIED